MDNNKLDNEHSETPSPSLKDYEKEITDKKSFFSSLLDKFKTNKNQKLLTNGEDTKAHTTNRSISSLWGIGNIRASLFTSLDNIRKTIWEKFSSEQPRNTLAVEIISEKSKDQVEKSLSDDNTIEVKSPPIIPNTKSKNIINNSKSAQDIRIEVASIDASAVDEKTEQIDDKKSDITDLSTDTPKPKSLDERE